MASLLNSLFGPKRPKIVEVLSLGVRFEVPSGQTVLEAALKNNVAFPHNCTVGSCGSCKCKLKQGRVGALSDFGYTLSQQEIAAGFILACQAVPKDELTVLEVESQAIDASKPDAFKGRIAATEPLTHDILRITVELDRPVKFVAGQYANLKLPDVARARNYSFADAPETEGLRNVNFFIRKVPGGSFTEALFSGRLNGATLDVEAPHGNFHMRPGSAPMVCIAGGSGLAPLLSMLTDAQRRQTKRPCVMLFGARTQSDLYGLKEIAAVADNWADQFVFLPVLSHEPADSSWTGARGLVTQFIADTIPAVDWSLAEGYMCGPPGMIDAGLSAMTELGMKLDAVFYDKFTDESHTAKMP